jgi:hypothetical protein
MSGLLLGITAASGPAGVGDFESIATVTVGSGGASSIEFANIPQGYQHLQIRMSAITSVGGDLIQVRLNSDSGSNYAYHNLSGNGSAASSAGATSQTRFFTYGYQWGTDNVHPAAIVADILDYASPSKATTMRSFSGMDENGAGEVNIYSGLWNSTSAVTRITMNLIMGAFSHRTTAALYGVKA